MKKSIKNETNIKKGCVLYSIWNKDNVDLNRVTHVTVLNKRVIDVTVLKLGTYVHTGEKLDDRRYSKETRNRYEHIIMKNSNAPQVLIESDFYDRVSWHYDRKDCEKKLKDNFMESKYWELIYSAKAIWEFLNGKSC